MALKYLNSTASDTTSSLPQMLGFPNLCDNNMHQCESIDPSPRARAALLNQSHPLLFFHTVLKIRASYMKEKFVTLFSSTVT